MKKLIGDAIEISVVVRDLEAAIKRYGELFVLSVHKRGESKEFGFKNAMLPLGAGHIELMEPTDPNKPVGKFLAKKGEGVYLIGFEAEDIPVWYPWPSLVDHRESPSLVPGRGHSGRVAHQFIGVDTSALTIDFSGSVLRLPNADSYRPGGPTTMLFYSQRYDNFALPAAGVRFKDNFFEATTAGQIATLQMPHVKRRGIRPATEEETAAWSARNGRGELTVVSEPAPVETPAETVELREPAPVDPQDAEPVEETPTEDDSDATGTADGDVPDGSAADVLAWVDGDPDRARAAADAERAGKQRKTLLADLDKIAE